MRGTKRLLSMLLVLIAIVSLESCGIFKKDCGCPSPTNSRPIK